MRDTAIDGAIGGDQSLADHLPAEHALPADLRAHAAKQIHLERFDVENGEKLVQRAAHDFRPLPVLQAERNRARRREMKGFDFPPPDL